MNAEKMSFFEFCERLKRDGAYIGDDWHLYYADGRKLSRQARNGYYVVRRMYDNICYYFVEHRIIWYFNNGEFDESLVVNHKDFDRANNNIDNLELVTQKENVHYTVDHGRLNPLKGPDSPKAYLTEKEVQTIRWLKKEGWRNKDMAALFNVPNANLVSRVIHGARYGSVPDAADIVAIYPILVNRTARTDLNRDKQMVNATLGLVGEAGEFADVIKKAQFHGHDYDVGHMVEELGDILFYLCWWCNLLDVDFADLCYQNTQKLLKRYPNGFSTEDSVARVDVSGTNA